eukprot:SRR837773.12764.p2 GENE.SRR837773.12764~~SRR837773.12764.p2  ORF type:complete len:161 (-),score=45.03 SRR837773.12764:301-735(-)
MGGPQTFNVEAFSKEDLAEARRRMGGRGARTTYTETFSQFPRSRIARHGPVTLALDEPKAEMGANLTRHASAPLLRERTAADAVLGHPPLIKRTGPHWPPPTKERPDPVKVRAALMGGVHRTLDDLHAVERPAPRSCSYTMTSF